MKFTQKLKMITTCSAILATVAPIMSQPVITTVHAATQDNNVIKVTIPQNSQIYVPDETVPNYTKDDVKLSNTQLTVDSLAPTTTIYKNKQDAIDDINGHPNEDKQVLKTDIQSSKGDTYYQVSEIIFNAPEANHEYQINNGLETKTYTSDENKQIHVKMLSKVSSVDSDNPDGLGITWNYTPILGKSDADKTDPIDDSPTDNPTPDIKDNDQIDNSITFVNKQGTIYNNNQTINASSNIKDPSNKNLVLAPDSIQHIVQIINDMGLVSKKKNDNAVVKVSNDQIKQQLTTAKIDYDKNGNLSLPATGFTYMVKAANGGIINIKFTSENSNYDKFPIIKFNKLDVAQGNNTFNENPVATINLNDKNWRQDVLKQFSAVQSTTDSSDISLKDTDLYVDDFNEHKIGVYPAILKVSNSAGKTTYLHFNIGIKGLVQDQIENKVVINATNSQAKYVDTYQIKNKTLQDLGQTGKLQTYSNVMAYNDQLIDHNTKYTRLYKPNMKRQDTNIWVKTENLVDSADQKKDQAMTKELMHAAYLYNKQGKRVNDSVLKSYSYVQVLYNNKIKIGNRYFYQLANSHNYIAAGNIDPAYRKIKHNAYIYTNRGKHVTRITKGTIQKHGKTIKIKKKQNLFYKLDQTKGQYVRTYGARFKIKFKSGKSTKTIECYRVGKNRYVKVSDFVESVQKQVPASNNIGTTNTLTDNQTQMPTSHN